MKLATRCITFFFVITIAILEAESVTYVGARVLLFSATGDSTIEPTLIVARRMLDAQGILYDEVSYINGTTRLPRGTSLPPLRDQNGNPNYCASIMVTYHLSYQDPSDIWTTALPTAHDNELSAVESQYKLRRVVLYTYPSASEVGVGLYSTSPTSRSDSCVMSFSSIASAYTKQFVEGYTLNFTAYRVPAKIIDPNIAKVFALFDATSVAAVVATINGVEQLHFFTSHSQYFAYSAILGTIWTNWAVNNVMVGSRRLYLSTAMDDVLLSTEQWDPSMYTVNNNWAERCNRTDLYWHRDWVKTVNARLPAGSNYRIEMPYNGAGVDNRGGLTGNDDLFAACKELVNDYFWLSHTYSHLDLTTADQTPTTCFGCTDCAGKETTFNDAFCELNRNKPFGDAITQTDCGTNNNDTKLLPSKCSTFSPHALVNPLISGLFNPNALRAMVETNIIYAVGDNSVAKLVPDNLYHARVTTTDYNGYPGVVIVPRFPTEIYYNNAFPEDNVAQYNYRTQHLTGKNITFPELIQQEKTRVMKYLMEYRHEPYMFHQGNLKVYINRNQDYHSYLGKASLLSEWVDALVDEYSKTCTYPLHCLRQEILGHKYEERMERDTCNPTVYFAYDDLNRLLGFNVTSIGVCTLGVTTGNTVVPLTSANVSVEQYGPDSTTWVKLGGGSSSIFVPIAVSTDVIPVVSNDIYVSSKTEIQTQTHTYTVSMFAFVFEVHHPMGPGNRDVGLALLQSAVTSKVYDGVCPLSSLPLPSSVSSSVDGVSVQVSKVGIGAEYKLMTEFSAVKSGNFCIQVLYSNSEISNARYTVAIILPTPTPVPQCTNATLASPSSISIVLSITVVFTLIPLLATFTVHLYYSVLWKLLPAQKRQSSVHTRTRTQGGGTDVVGVVGMGLSGKPMKADWLRAIPWSGFVAVTCLSPVAAESWWNAYPLSGIATGCFNSLVYWIPLACVAVIPALFETQMLTKRLVFKVLRRTNCATNRTTVNIVHICLVIVFVGIISVLTGVWWSWYSAIVTCGFAFMGPIPASSLYSMLKSAYEKVGDEPSEGVVDEESLMDISQMNDRIFASGSANTPSEREREREHGKTHIPALPAIQNDVSQFGDGDDSSLHPMQRLEQLHASHTQHLPPITASTPKRKSKSKKQPAPGSSSRNRQQLFETQQKQTTAVGNINVLMPPMPSASSNVSKPSAPKPRPRMLQHKKR